jgi:hypothetical protein
MEEDPAGPSWLAQMEPKSNQNRHDFGPHLDSCQSKSNCELGRAIAHFEGGLENLSRAPDIWNRYRIRESQWFSWCQGVVNDSSMGEQILWNPMPLVHERLSSIGIRERVNLSFTVEKLINSYVSSVGSPIMM